jgi:uncharacterized membrane protein HdeD (DUF308 family)
VSSQGFTGTSERLAVAAPQSWWVPVLHGVLAIVFGIIALVSPTSTAFVLTIVIGAYAIVDGVMDIVLAIQRRRSEPTALRIVLGVVSVLFGLVVLVWPGLSLSVLPFLAAAWAIVIGILQFSTALGARKQASRSWIWSAIVGVLWVLIGVFMLFHPLTGLVVLILALGLWAVVIGIVWIVGGIQLRRETTSTRAPAAGA